MRYRASLLRKIVIIFIMCLFIGANLSINATLGRTVECEKQKTFPTEMKTIYIKADCQKIILYSPVGWITHIGPLWFTSENAYLAFIIDKEFTFRLNGQSQTVPLPAMVIPYKFIGLGPLFYIQSITRPVDGNITLIGWCEDVFIHPFE